jgi:transposase
LAQLRQRVPELIEDASNELPGTFRVLVQRLLDHLNELKRQASELEAQIVAWHRQHPLCRAIEKIPGVGPLTASAIVASVGDAKNFESARQLSAWLGLVPRQHSSGGRTNLLGISKRGDTYLRTLLVHGARAVVSAAKKKPNPSGWLHELLKRRSVNVVVVALANKMARTIWALLAKGVAYEADHMRCRREAAAA